MRPLYYLFLLFVNWPAMAQLPSIKQLPAKRTTASIKIDGELMESAWKDAIPASGFVEWRPNPGVPEDSANRTVVYLLYDNNSVYVGGYCYERTSDSISRELVGRDKVGINDFVGVILDTYYDKINATGFYVTPYGEQFDAKYSNTDRGEDASWDGVWDSEAKIHADGWSFEMRIPYSALRFVSRDNQTWGLNITRRRNKTGQQYMWNPVDPKVNGFINQEGAWTGIEKIEAPVRLSFSPYLSYYANHYPNHTPGIKDFTSSFNGGMDVKYGISNAFTLDMTLIPDFGQVQSDNRVLNLTPFEVKYNENRPFFTEGTELFNKGDLFYSRRIGGTPLHYSDVVRQLNAGESILKNPAESKLLNATKVSGRTKKGLGIGFFNAITKTMYAEVATGVNKERRMVETNPLTNFNILVFDQTLKNNSSVSFINTSVLRSGTDYDANVSAALFNFNNKKNTFNWNGKVALSHLTASPGAAASTGYSHNIGFGKTGGRWNFQVGQEMADKNYSINDMGIQYYNNYVDHTLWTAYRWLTPTNWYNRVQVNYNLYHSQLFTPVLGQKANTRFQRFTTNVNANAQFKNLWWAGIYIGYAPQGNDFYEPRTTGFSFRTTRKLQFSPWVETNRAKKYYASISNFFELRQLFGSVQQQVEVMQRYRFSDKFSLSHSISYNPITNDAGFYGKHYQKDASGIEIRDAYGNRILDGILFSRRNVKTIENILSAKFNFNNRSGITFRARHYWSKVHVRQLYDLAEQGNLSPTVHTDAEIRNQNFNIFNIDAVYTLQFAPGSFLNVVWKDAGVLSDRVIERSYFGNFHRTLAEPQNNSLSIKIIYFLDYLSLKKNKS